MSFFEATHAAEKRQAELDPHAFAKEKKALKVWLFYSFEKWTAHVVNA